MGEELIVATPGLEPGTPAYEAGEIPFLRMSQYKKMFGDPRATYPKLPYQNVGLRA